MHPSPRAHIPQTSQTPYCNHAEITKVGPGGAMAGRPGLIFRPQCVDSLLPSYEAHLLGLSHFCMSWGRGGIKGIHNQGRSLQGFAHITVRGLKPQGQHRQLYRGPPSNSTLRSHPGCCACTKGRSAAGAAMDPRSPGETRVNTAAPANTVGRRRSNERPGQIHASQQPS